MIHMLRIKLVELCVWGGEEGCGGAEVAHTHMHPLNNANDFIRIGSGAHPQPRYKQLAILPIIRLFGIVLFSVGPPRPRNVWQMSCAVVPCHVA